MPRTPRMRILPRSQHSERANDTLWKTAVAARRGRPLAIRLVELRLAPAIIGDADRLGAAAGRGGDRAAGGPRNRVTISTRVATSNSAARPKAADIPAPGRGAAARGASGRRRGAPRRRAHRAEDGDRTASPSEPPTCCMTLTMLEAAPESCAGRRLATPWSAARTKGRPDTEQLIGPRHPSSTRCPARPATARPSRRSIGIMPTIISRFVPNTGSSRARAGHHRTDVSVIGKNATPPAAAEAEHVLEELGHEKNMPNMPATISSRAA